MGYRGEECDECYDTRSEVEDLGGYPLGEFLRRRQQPEVIGHYAAIGKKGAATRKANKDAKK